MRLRWIISLGILIVAAFPATLPGQAVGELRGTVNDPSSAVVPNATVTAEQAGTGLTRSALTGASGAFSIPALPVGTYTLTVQAAGFKNASSEVKGMPGRS